MMLIGTHVRMMIYDSVFMKDFGIENSHLSLRTAI